MKRFFTLILAVLAVSFAMGQAPVGVFAKASVAPEIDGEVDAVWAEAEVYNIDKPYKTEVPTLGEPGESTWQGVYTEEGVYILLKVTDDAFLPAATGQNRWDYDNAEIYFDVNFETDDGKGASGGLGHIQVAPSFTEGSNDGTPMTIASGATAGVEYAFLVTEPNYVAEYFIPFSVLIDMDGNQVDPTNTIGFDVTLIDRDPDDTARKRAVWANIGAKDESWNNLDDAGDVTFEGAEPLVAIESITITGASEISADNGTIQFSSSIMPADATQPAKWIITNGTGMATINKEGLVTALKDGTVMVKAASADDFVSSNEITVTISNQKVTHFESSFIKDGDFTMGTGTKPSAVWEGGAMVENGVLTITNTNATPGPDPWSWTVGQIINIPQEMKDLPFVLQLTAWADEPRIFDVDIENIGGNYVRFGDSPDPRADAGHSQWRLDLTTERQVFTLEITNFSRMDPVQEQKFNLFAGMALAKVYVDSIFLVTKDDFILRAKGLVNSINKVYPNPVGNGNTLFVELSKINTNVAIYNAVGQKLMEKVSTGNLVKFDVKSLRQGIYFVKLSDGSVQKFVR